MRNARIMIVLLAGALGLGACKRDDMADGGKLKPLEESPRTAGASVSRPLIFGTVTRDGRVNTDPTVPWGAARPQAWLRPEGPTSLPGQAPVATSQPSTFPFPITRADLERGRERFTIFCTPCHGQLGDGNGMIVQRGFTRPPSYHIDRLRQAPPSYFVQVMTNGIGAMFSYADRVPENDRWRIAAYIKALQLSQHAPASDLPAATQKAAGQTTGATPRSKEQP